MFELPRQVLIESRVTSSPLDDVAGATARELARVTRTFEQDPWRGRRIAVAVGSRGINKLPIVVRAVIDTLRAAGATPFILPAMGSHGGSTAEGQIEMLESLGVTEASAGAPIHPSMETTEIGRSAAGYRVHVSREALAADAIVLINRVKPHTDFASEEIGSGLRKMCAIGLGKADGAFECHRSAARGHGMGDMLKDVSTFILAKVPIVCGVALVEDGLHQLARVEAVLPHDIPAREPHLLAEARAFMPALPFTSIDVLIVDQIGKNISGSGMDTNIVGRGVDGKPRMDRRVDVRTLYARSVTPESHGNVVGMGMADIVSSKLVADMDPVSTYANALSAMTPAMVRIPMHFPTDAECMKAAVRMAGADLSDTRIVRMRDTLTLDRFVVSEACAAALEGQDGVRVAVPPSEWRMGADGNFDPATDLLMSRG